MEFAIALPFLAIIVFGTIDLGRAYLAWLKVKNAAREGAAYAQLHPGRLQPNGPNCADPDNIQWHARAEAGGDTSLRVFVNPSPAGGCADSGPAPGQDVTVTTEKDFTLLTPIVQRLVGNPVRVRASVKVTVQG